MSGTQGYNTLEHARSWERRSVATKRLQPRKVRPRHRRAGRFLVVHLASQFLPKMVHKRVTNGDPRGGFLKCGVPLNHPVWFGGTTIYGNTHMDYYDLLWSSPTSWVASRGFEESIDAPSWLSCPMTDWYEFLQISWGSSSCTNNSQKKLSHLQFLDTLSSIASIAVQNFANPFRSETQMIHFMIGTSTSLRISLDSTFKSWPSTPKLMMCGLSAWNVWWFHGWMGNSHGFDMFRIHQTIIESHPPNAYLTALRNHSEM